MSGGMEARGGWRRGVGVALAGGLLALYPRAWRARYREETLALLEDVPITPRTLSSLLDGALDARLHPRWLPAQSSHAGEKAQMTQRVQRAANVILAAFTLFFIAWVMVPFIGDARGPWQAATAAYPAIGWALAVFEIAGAVGALALLVGGAPLVAVAVRQALRGRRDLLWRLAVPLALAGVVTAYSWLAVPNWWLRERLSPNDLTSSATAMRLSFFVFTFAAVALSAWAVVSAASRARPAGETVRFTIIPGVIVSVALSTGLVALVTLTALVFVEAPGLAGPFWLLPGFVALVLCACLVANVAALRMVASGGGGEGVEAGSGPA